MRTKFTLLIVVLAISTIAAVPDPKSPSKVPDKAMPKVLEPIAKFVAEAVDAPLNRVRFKGMRETTFPNSCLGIQTEGVQCLDVMTDGYILRFRTPRGRVTVHANAALSRYVIAGK
jgi:hypothetical protein